jgi:membrane fusion protein (multidrug efflux system)
MSLTTTTLNTAPRGRPIPPDFMAHIDNGHGDPATARNPRGVVEDPHDPRLARQPQRPSGGRSFLWLYGLIFLVVLGCIVAFVIIRKNAQSAQLSQTTQEMSVPTVLVVNPQPGSGEVHLVLPGAVQAYMQTSVYAQISGYIKSWNVDIGAPVKQGELLATIEAPVVEQNLFQVQANLALAQTTAARYNNLLSSHAVSQQDVDNQNANVAVMEANVKAAQAGVSSIEHQLAFRQVTAPFDGIVTARRVDVGDLVSAAGGTATTTGTTVAGTTPSAGGSTELFQVSKTDILRVYVTVPEQYSTEVLPGVQAHIGLASNPNESIPGTLVRTAKAIDPNSLTLLAEIDVQNASRRLFPGGYAQVHFDLNDPHPPMLIPGNALIFRAQGTQAGLVDDNGKVTIRDIKLGRDFGTKVEVIDGLTKTDQVIVNPSDSISDGQQVKVKKQDDAAKAANPRS